MLPEITSIYHEKQVIINKYNNYLNTSPFEFFNNRINSRLYYVLINIFQSKELCALHALNNLFQSKEAFKQMELDAICFSLSPNNCINPHRSILGLGNYDVNVLIAALQNKGYSVFWFDKRKLVLQTNILY